MGKEDKALKLEERKLHRGMEIVKAGG